MDAKTSSDSPGKRGSDSAGTQARTAADDARETLEASAQPMMDKARGMAEEQKSAGAAKIETLSRSVHAAAQELEKELPAAARYIHSAADTLENASSEFRNRSVDDLFGTFGDFARKQPAAAFAGSVIVGFALSRFLKSSSDSRPVSSPAGNSDSANNY